MSLPIATVADLSQVERLRSFVEGRSCVVVGSAPMPSSTADVLPEEVVIAVNGSISSLPGPADVWVLNSKQQDKPGSPSLKPLHRIMLSQGKGKQAGHLVLLRGPKIESEAYTLATLDALGCQYQSWSVLDKLTKRKFEGDTCARVSESRPCSAGILTVAMSLWCGAEHVRMVGFSLSPGYHYLSHVKPQYWWRDHVEADRRALKALTARYGERLSGPILQKVAA